jgi:2-methylcitrate dehydratase PrpD
MATLGRRIADWVAGMGYADLPEGTVHEAKRRILDSIGTCLGAYHSRPAKVARAMAAAVRDTRGGHHLGHHTLDHAGTGSIRQRRDGSLPGL